MFNCKEHKNFGTVTSTKKNSKPLPCLFVSWGVGSPGTVMQKKKMRHTLRDDLRQGGFIKNLKSEFQALQAFYLDEDEREQLKQMGWFRKFFKSMIWLFKGLFYNMTPFRRLLFVAAVILFFSISAQVNGNQVDVQRNGSILSMMVFIFILMLEVKDKLLATSELRHGRAVQEALLPEAQPKFDGWDIYLYSYPANDVGGDLIDFNATGEQSADIALGDVAGKGLPAALFMANCNPRCAPCQPRKWNYRNLYRKPTAFFVAMALPVVLLHFFIFGYTKKTANCAL